MIQAVVTRIDECIKVFEVKGHSRYGPYGKDIVCAGVSALCQACAESLEKLTAGRFLIRIENGDFYLEVLDYASGEDAVKINVLLEGLLIGLNSIEESYPKYIKVMERRG
ncbi:ribosomal-processing cysteine protease Prp [Calorimonas adulescens]|jgi:Protein of unknown function (DUF464).|uniref:Ribosomal processing cysteine protease Prp n=1 Tax=Calorimonas adulescens TaxID=2606906 RepID=A0A5D8QDJ6_9THEO|nr:ribosomal-processing cysteine protease Prp [Calorimonas adulescens]TZE82234.1 ribosomal-processing cysteine protease Prp [Calorimonas adulescens]